MELVTIWLSLALLLVLTEASGKHPREVPNIPPNATLASLGFRNLDSSVPRDARVMMVESFAGQGRVAWINNWQEAWLEEGFVLGRRSAVVGYRQGMSVRQRKRSSKSDKKDRENIKTESRARRDTEMYPGWRETYRNPGKVNGSISPPSFFSNQAMIRNKRQFRNNFPEVRGSRNGIRELPHKAIKISRYDIFISRYGMYIFIPAMMTFTLVYILFLKWKCLDNDLIGPIGFGAIFRGAGIRMLHGLSPTMRRDPMLGKLYVTKHVSKKEEKKVKDLFRGISSMGRNVV